MFQWSKEDHLVTKKKVLPSRPISLSVYLVYKGWFDILFIFFYKDDNSENQETIILMETTLKSDVSFSLVLIDKFLSVVITNNF